MKFPLAKLTLIGSLALSLAACNDMNREGTGVQDGVQQNDYRPNSVRWNNAMDDPRINNTRVNDMNSRRFGYNFVNGDDFRSNRWNTRNNNWDNRWNNNTVSPHNNTRMEMSQDIADNIADMDGVRSANVLLTDNNAYVAVVLDNNAGRTNNRTGNNGMRNGTMGMRNNGVTGNNAGGNMTDYDVSDQMKERIANRVKSLNRDVKNVYVSANPGFVDRMRGYADSFANGRPLRGLIIEFNEMVDRLFPVNAGSENNARINGRNDRTAEK